MKQNGESIYSTTASPFKLLPWGRCTKKVGNGSATLYLHVFNWPADGKLVVYGLKNQAKSAYLLADASKTKLAAANDADGLIVTVPASVPDKISSTVVLQVKGALDIEQMPPMQDADGAVVLLASEATLHGDTIKYDGARRKECLGSWTEPGDSAEWIFKIIKPGKFSVAAEISSLKSSSLEVAIGDQSQIAAVAATGDYAKFKAVKLGVVDIKIPGKASLSLKAVKEGWDPINVKAVTLKPTE
jgi:alpha-L-fucosidase